MTLVVLAAGMGSRYGGMKQIDPITENGEFIIDFSVYDAIKAGFDKVVFIIKEEMLDDFKETVGKRVSPFIQVDYAFQKMDKNVPADKLIPGRTKPWGTTHALLCAKDKVTDNFAVLNADDFYGRGAFVAIADFLKNAKDTPDNMHAAMVGYVLGNTLTENGTVSRGVCVVEDGMLKEIVERTKIAPDGETAAFYEGDVKTALPYDTMVSMNFWGFTPSIFSYLEKSFAAFLDKTEGDPLKRECYLPMTVGEAMADGVCDVKAYKTDAKWYGVTYGEDKAAVMKGIRSFIDIGEYPNGLWK
ncbi:MAG: nucleotidyltransferase [Clostridia bacterium]|nr:nucleotidyltransferase [Clostridia bacterium]